MKCPRCVQRIHRAASACPHCGYTLGQADERFGHEEVRLKRLTDTAGLLRKGERVKVEAALQRFDAKFPQLFVAVYTGVLGEVANLRQFGFWLLNRTAFEDVAVEKPNEAGILLTLDPESKGAGIVFGYLLDPFLEESDTFECLSRAHAYWLEGKYAEGIIRAVEQLEVVLKKRSRQARRDPEKFERKVKPSAQVGDLVKRIRAGHRAEPVERNEEVER
ncbi:MAG: TPM domain-containing protein [Luteolibacter sp.]